MKLKYVGVQEISRSEAELAFNSNDTFSICQALVNIIHSDQDWLWLQSLCLKFISDVDLSDSHLSDRDTAVVGLAITCLGHIARIHRKLDLQIVLPALEIAKQNEKLAGRVGDALDDIHMFLPKRMFKKK
jgi:hypothetical protein